MVSSGNQHLKKTSKIQSYNPIFQQFEAQLSSLYEMLNLIKTHALKYNIPKQRIWRMELVAEEVIMNIISYAYSDKDSIKPINLCCIASNSTFTIHIKDQGIPFNPLNMTRAKSPFHFDLEEPISGGMGILLMKSYCDHISYEYIERENCISLQFSLIKV